MVRDSVTIYIACTREANRFVLRIDAIAVVISIAKVQYAISVTIQFAAFDRIGEPIVVRVEVESVADAIAIVVIGPLYAIGNTVVVRI